MDETALDLFVCLFVSPKKLSASLDCSLLLIKEDLSGEISQPVHSYRDVIIFPNILCHAGINV